MKIFNELKFIEFISKFHWYKRLFQQRKVKPIKNEDFLRIHESDPGRMRTPKRTCQDQLLWSRQARKIPARSVAPCPHLLDGQSMVGLIWGEQLEDKPAPQFWAAARWPKSNPHLPTFQIPGQLRLLYQHILHWPLITGTSSLMRSTHHPQDTLSPFLKSAVLATALTGWSAICFGSNPVGYRGVLSSGAGVNISALTSWWPWENWEVLGVLVSLPVRWG